MFLAVGKLECAHQSVTYRYREFPVPGIFIFFGGIGTGLGRNWYRKKVSELVSEKFGTGKGLETAIEKFGTGADFVHQNF